MTVKSRETPQQKQAGTLLELQATAAGMFFGSMFKAAGLQKAMAENSAELGRSMIDAATRTQQEITRMSLEAISHGDPIALMTLAPRAAQTGYREGIDCAARVLQSAQSLGKAILGTDPQPPEGGTEQS